MSRHVAGILLAAGGSTRMGTPKQLLPYRGRTLVAHAATTLASSLCRPIVVVVGADGEAVRAELRELPVSIVENPCWRDGIGASVAAGISSAEELHPAIDAAVVTLVDQPLVTADLLNALVRTYEGGDYLASACSYDGTLGVPALFGRPLFDELKSLPPEHGAKSVLMRNAARIAAVAFPPAASDIDTPEQYEQIVRG